MLLKEKQITKKKDISNTPLNNAKSEKEKQIKNDQKRTSSKGPNLNQPPGFGNYLYNLAEEIWPLCSFRRNS